LWLLVGFVIVVFILDIVITGAIPKWAIFAPVFIPLLMRLNMEPEAVLAAYRVGDSPMNAITPLNAYFAMIVTFAEKYQEDSGVGTVIALMLPYVVILCVLWTLLLMAWYLLGLPWGSADRGVRAEALRAPGTRNADRSVEPQRKSGIPASPCSPLRLHAGRVGPASFLPQRARALDIRTSRTPCPG
jgi:hypothetical protein